MRILDTQGRCRNNSRLHKVKKVGEGSSGYRTPADIHTGAESIHQQSSQYSRVNDERIFVVLEEKPDLEIHACGDVSAAIAVSNLIRTWLNSSVNKPTLIHVPTSRALFQEILGD